MLNENIKAMRQNKNLTQEQLAAELHVVRQTVSKWEKGLSVPDAELLQSLAEVLGTDVATLLGVPVAPAETDAVAEQLMRINEQLVIRNRRSRRIWRVVLWLLAGLAALCVLCGVLYNELKFEPAVLHSQNFSFEPVDD